MQMAPVSDPEFRLQKRGDNDMLVGRKRPRIPRPNNNRRLVANQIAGVYRIAARALGSSEVWETMQVELLRRLTRITIVSLGPPRAVYSGTALAVTNDGGRRAVGVLERAPFARISDESAFT